MKEYPAFLGEYRTVLWIDDVVLITAVNAVLASYEKNGIPEYSMGGFNCQGFVQDVLKVRTPDLL